MGTGERLRITLTGGAPWGFRLQGGGSYPLEVAKIRKKSFAHEAGLREGDVVLAINGYQLTGRSHQSAMDLVDMASNTLEFEIARPTSSQGATRPLDPQRQLRIIPVVSGQENTGPGIISSAQADFSTTEGNVRTDIHTEEYTMKSPAGKKITKTVTEQRVTRLGSNDRGLSPVPPTQVQGHASPGGHVSRSPNRSPVMWQPKSLSPAQTQSNISQNQSKSPASWQPKGTSPSPAAPSGSHNRNQRPTVQKRRDEMKENLDPILLSEQAKWEAKTGPQNVPKFKLENFGSTSLNTKANYVPQKVEDPRYPMFEVPKPDWSPPKKVQPSPQEQMQQSPPQQMQQIKVPPPVAPKPLSPATLSPVPFEQSERPVASREHHLPGMIRPPVQLNLAPAPPPPPMPPAPQKWTAPQIKKFRPGPFSMPVEEVEEEEEEVDEMDHPTSRPDHLPVFGPKVYFGLDDDSGFPMSPDQHSDISSTLGLHKKKLLFSDSMFYDDSTHRFPTIDEQMSMCKKIAQSLTSAANKRAKGARMFAKRKRKSNKWVHDQNTVLLGGSEYSSSAGDVADLNDLDSELYYDEGGIRPLFTFRIPKLAGQVSQGQKMSLSKDEFERLRLAAPRVDHHAVSPDTCFNIAADLHRGGKNKGAKLFQKRQARVEKFVIDDTNVNKAPMNPTKLEKILLSPEGPPTQHKTPWNAAAQGNVNAAFQKNQRAMHLPKHTLQAENQPKVLEGRTFNKVARGWMGSSPAHVQHSYYRDSTPTQQSYDISTTYREWHGERHTPERMSPASEPSQQQSLQYGNYNRRIKAWPAEHPPVMQQRTVQSHSEQANFNTLPRSFGGYRQEPVAHGYGYCDL